MAAPSRSRHPLSVRRGSVRRRQLCHGRQVSVARAAHAEKQSGRAVRCRDGQSQRRDTADLDRESGGDERWLLRPAHATRGPHRAGAACGSEQPGDLWDGAAATATIGGDLFWGRRCRAAASRRLGGSARDLSHRQPTGSLQDSVAGRGLYDLLPRCAAGAGGRADHRGSLVGSVGRGAQVLSAGGDFSPVRECAAAADLPLHPRLLGRGLSGAAARCRDSHAQSGAAQLR